MKEYVKAVLYAYPLLKNIKEDYEEYIRNKALLSYRNFSPTVEIATQIATQIAERDNLLWLKDRVEVSLGALSEEERALVTARYFTRESKEKGVSQGNAGRLDWSERKYFRMQNRVGDKLERLLEKIGVREETFDELFANIDIFQRICHFVKNGEEKTKNRNKLPR